MGQRWVHQGQGFPRLRAWLLVSMAALLAVLALLPAGLARSVGAQSAPVVWELWDTTYVINTDGTVDVTERQVIQFNGGPYRTAFATFSLERTDDLTDVRVSEETDAGIVPYERVRPSDFDIDDPQTYAVQATSTEVEVNWAFPRTTGESRTFLIQYRLDGVIRQYLENDPPNQQFWRTVIPPDVPEIAPIEQAVARIVLPQPIALEDARVDQYEDDNDIPADPGASLNPADFTEDGQTFTFTASDLDSSGEGLVIRLQFPPLVNAPIPSWQQADDARRQAEAERADQAATLNLIFLAAGILLAIVGAILIFSLWYTAGRDPQIGLVADLVPEPPDDLPPGAAGALIDEQVHYRDVLATLVDLGQRGIISMTEKKSDHPLGAIVPLGTDFEIKLEKDDPGVTPMERDLLHVLFGKELKAGETTMLSEVKPRFEAAIPSLTEDLYEELVVRGYFERSPEATRKHWNRIAGAVLAISIIGGVVVGFSVGGLAGWIWFPVIVGVILAFVFRRLANSMPKKTVKGAEAAAKWRAFKRYLASLEQYEQLQVENAKVIFDRFLPYAIAFGIERQFVAKFQQAGNLPELLAGGLSTVTTMPFGGPQMSGGYPFDPYQGPYQGRRVRRGRPVFMPIFWGGSSGSGGQRRESGNGGGGGDGFDMPDLDSMSGRTFEGLGNASGGLFDMLNAASRVFGGRGGGGGWGGGGRGGGGFGGFGGGGGFGGSGGGGSRGFG